MVRSPTLKICLLDVCPHDDSLWGTTLLCRLTADIHAIVVNKGAMNTRIHQRHGKSSRIAQNKYVSHIWILGWLDSINYTSFQSFVAALHLILTFYIRWCIKTAITEFLNATIKPCELFQVVIILILRFVGTEQKIGKSNSPTNSN